MRIWDFSSVQTGGTVSFCQFIFCPPSGNRQPDTVPFRLYASGYADRAMEHPVEGLFSHVRDHLFQGDDADSDLDSMRENYSLCLLPLTGGIDADRVRQLAGCMAVRERADIIHAVFSTRPEESGSIIKRELGVQNASCRRADLEEMFIELVGGSCIRISLGIFQALYPTPPIRDCRI